MKQPLFTLITQKDPWGAITGGQVAFARCLLNAFGGEMAVACHASAELPVGEWTRRVYRDEPVHFYNMGQLSNREDRKPLLPMRLQSYLRAMPHMRRLREFHDVCLIDSPELLFLASRFRWRSGAYRFAGMNNPVSNSRYRALRCGGAWFERRMLRALERLKPDVCLAAASGEAIGEFCFRTGADELRRKIVSFPTCADGRAFYPQDREEARKILKIAGGPVLVSVGRLCWIKGWELLLDAFALLRESSPDAQLFLVGDGEDRPRIEARITRLNLGKHVHITGFIGREQVARHIAAADLCLVGSFREGWSLAMCEYLACGRPVIATPVSGAREMVEPGRNGWIVEERNPAAYAEAIRRGLALENGEEYSLAKAGFYSDGRLRSRLTAAWPQLMREGHDEDTDRT